MTNSFQNENINNLNESIVNDLNETANLLKNSLSNANMSNKPLTAETLKILSSISIENLSLNSQFDLLFNDLSMLKASAVQGLLGITNFRFLAWMIFLECLPIDKSKWIETINQNRKKYEDIRNELCCDPRKMCLNNKDDHPLSQNKSSVWNKYFWHNELKTVIIQDVNRM